MKKEIIFETKLDYANCEFLNNLKYKRGFINQTVILDLAEELEYAARELRKITEHADWGTVVRRKHVDIINKEFRLNK